MKFFLAFGGLFCVVASVSAIVTALIVGNANGSLIGFAFGLIGAILLDEYRIRV